MVNAIVLICVEPSRISEVAERLAAIEHVSEVYSVGGRFDVIAVVRVPDNEALSTVVTEHFLKLEGIRSTETCIAFRVYSRYDLERLFAVGMQD